MTLNKYDEVMEHLSMTDERKARILDGIEQRIASQSVVTQHTDANQTAPVSMDEYRQKNKKSVIIPILTSLGTLAAVVALVVLIPWSKIGPIGTQVSATDGYVQWTAATEDSHMAGFSSQSFDDLVALNAVSPIEMNALEALPFDSMETKYLLYNGNPVIEYYRSDYICLSYGRYEEEGDHTGFEWPFTFSRKTEINGQEVCLKGAQHTIMVAYWREDDITTYLTYEEGLSMDYLEQVIPESKSAVASR